MSSGSGSPGEGISRQTWEGSASAIAVTDASGAIEYVNPAFERLTGYTAVDAVGQNMRILKSGAHPPEFYVELWGTITAGGKWSGRMQNRRKDGSFYIADVTISPVRDGRGAALHFTAVTDPSSVMDITGGEEDFFMQPLKLHLIATREGTIRRVNGVWRQILGYSEKEIEGTSFIDLIHPGDREATLREMEKLARGDSVVAFENRYLHKDGSYRTLSWSASQRLGTDVIHAAASDVTRSKQLEAKIAESERLFRDVLSNVDLVSATLDAGGNITFANDCLLQLTGWRLDEIVGRNWFDVFIPSGAPVRDVLLRDIAAGSVPISSENEILTRDGGRRLISWSNVLLRDARGEPSGIAGIGVDVTERRRTEAALAESEKKYRALFENSPDACFLVADGVILDCNHGAEFLLRGPKRDIVGKSLVDFSPEFQPVGRASAEAERALTLQALRGASDVCGEAPDATAAGGADGTSCHDGHMVFEWVHRRLDGEEFLAEVHTVPLVFEGRTVLLNTWRDVTERRRAEDKIRASEAKFLQAFMSSPLVMILTRAKDAAIMEVNPAFEQVLGFSREEAVGSTTADLGLWADPADHERLYRAMLESGNVEQLEMRLRKKNGEKLIGLLSARLFDLDGEPVLLGSVNDITERKAAEERLRETNAYLENLFNYANAPIIVWDTQFRITRFNRAFERLSGRREEDVLGQSLEILFPPESADASMELIRRTSGGERWEVVEIVIRNTDGSDRTVLWNSATIFGADGRTPVSTIAQGQDITERQRAEDRLRETNAYLENLVNYANAPIIVWDTRFRITRFNRAFERLSGRREADVLGRSLEILFPPESADASMELIHRTSGGERWEVVEIVIRNTDGSDRTVLWNSATIFGTDGRTPVSTIAQGQDITLRKEREAELAVAKEAAEEANRAKSDFLANMSHEIRTPMNGVIGMTHLLLDTDLSPEQRDYAETVRGSAESLLNILNDILDYTKIEAGKLELENIDFDLADLLADIASLLAPRAKDRGVVFRCTLAPDVPPRLRGDPGRVRQILLNLAGNAVKFTKEGEIAVDVSLLEEEADSARLLFSVADTGIGIPAEKQAHLFEKFTQADTSTTRRYGGTGLGLAIAKDLTGRMGGEIGVTSEEGRGSEFWFTVRLGRAESEGEAGAPGLENVAASIASLYHGDGRVLLAEDNPANAEVATGILGKMGLQVDIAANGDDALSLLAQKPYDLVLMDLQMPKVDGFEVTRRLRASGPDAVNREVPVIAMTARVMQDDRERCFAAGMNGHLRKPVSPRELAQVLHHWLPQGAAVSPVAHARGTDLPVLVVEDDPISLRLASRMLETFGLKTQEAANGQEAVAAFAPGRFAAILMDISMPVMDGLTATEKIRRIEEDAGSGRTPIIAFTANAMPGDRERCLAAGLDEFLTKPFRRDNLSAKLAAIIRT